MIKAHPTSTREDGDGPANGAGADLWGGRVTSDIPYERLMDGPLCFEIPEAPRPADDYFGRQIRHLSSHAVNLRSPRCLGHMTGIVPDFMARVHELVMTLNQNLVKVE